MHIESHSRLVEIDLSVDEALALHEKLAIMIRKALHQPLGCDSMSAIVDNGNGAGAGTLTFIITK